MPSDRVHEVIASIARRAYHLTPSEVLAVTQEDDDMPALKWARQHAHICAACSRDIEAMRRELENNEVGPPSAAALLLEGRAHRLIQTESVPHLFKIVGLKVTALIALKAKYAGERGALGVVQTPERSFTFVFDDLVDQRISIWDLETGEAPLRLAAATRDVPGKREPARTLWPALRLDGDAICEFFGDFYDDAFLRITTVVDES